MPHSRTLAFALVSLIAVACHAPHDAHGSASDVHHWGFDTSPTGALPPPFRAVVGSWRVEPDAGAVSPPNVLRLAGKPDQPEFKRVIADGIDHGDVRVRVRFRLESGLLDQAAGVMFRARDDDNYYLVRANALESNIRVYRVVKGERQRFPEALDEVSMETGKWYWLDVEARGDRIRIEWPGRKPIEVKDATFSHGAVGLWGKADSATVFDDLSVWELH